MLNQYFIPVYVDGTYLQANAKSEASELAAYRELFAEVQRVNAERRKTGRSVLSAGTVHAYVLSSDGQALDSRHVASAGPASVIEMLQAVVKREDVSAGKPIVAPHNQTPRPECANDALVLHLTARYLVPRQQTDARRNIDGDLVPRDASSLGGERSGGWQALPSEDWFVLQRDQWTELLPTKPISVGDSWQIKNELADTLLTRFYPTTELNDLGENRIDERSLTITVLSIEKDRVRGRIDGQLKMKHAFYPRRDDSNFVNATVIGTIEFDPTKPIIHSLEIVTQEATYGDQRRKQSFGVAVRIEP